VLWSAGGGVAEPLLSAGGAAGGAVESAGGVVADELESAGGVAGAVVDESEGALGEVDCCLEHAARASALKHNKRRLRFMGITSLIRSGAIRAP
jgi:hypothetical protein